MSQRRKVALKTYLVIRYLFRYFRNIKIQFLANVEINFNRSKNLQSFESNLIKTKNFINVSLINMIMTVKFTLY